MHLLEISNFFNKKCHPQTNQNYEQSRQKLGTFLGNVIYKSWSPNQVFFTEKYFWKDSTNFRHWKMTLKVKKEMQSLTRLFIILVSLTMSLFSETISIDALVVWFPTWLKNLGRSLIFTRTVVDSHKQGSLRNGQNTRFSAPKNQNLVFVWDCWKWQNPLFVKKCLMLLMGSKQSLILH